MSLWWHACCTDLLGKKAWHGDKFPPCSVLGASRSEVLHKKSDVDVELFLRYKFYFGLKCRILAIAYIKSINGLRISIDSMSWWRGNWCYFWHPFREQTSSKGVYFRMACIDGKVQVIFEPNFVKNTSETSRNSLFICVSIQGRSLQEKALYCTQRVRERERKEPCSTTDALLL